MAEGATVEHLDENGRPKNQTPVRSQVLSTADGLINGNRQQDYGDSSISFGRIAALWNAYLGTNLAIDLRADQVAVMMALLKVSRSVESPAKADTYVDLAGYAALAAELGGVEEV